MLSPIDPASASHLGMDELLSGMDTDRERGLSSGEADRRLSRFGKNTIAEARKKGIVSVLAEEIREPMILILVVVAVIYSLIGNLRDSLTIVSIVLALVGFEAYNINRAQKSMEALKSLAQPYSMVYRDGVPKEVGSSFIVPGDVILLTPGVRIPADGRLIDSYNLRIDESPLTGESFPVHKDYLSIPEKDEIAELTNMVFSGTLVSSGIGTMVATSTGRNTETGRIAELISQAEEGKTRLEESMERLAFTLVFVAVGFSIAIPVIGYLEGKALNTMIITALSLAFATVPEELPIVISLTLAVGAYELTRRNAIVRSLRAAETLGNVTVIATDKTGTITENSMSVGHTYYNMEIHESGVKPPDYFLEAGVLCTGTLQMDARVSLSQKDPMEMAVLDYASSKGTDTKAIRSRMAVREEFGFDNRRKLASYIYSGNGEESIYVSGAPEAVLPRASHILLDRGTEEMTDDLRNRIMESVYSITGMGERIIAISSSEGVDANAAREELENGLTFIGLISFIDPPRPEVKAAIEQCQDAGIRVIMLTGDHPNTAVNIAGKVGINHSGNVLTGPEISALDDNGLEERLDHVSIYARITSEDKLRIVQALKRKGEVVAVTGDGVNDSPALQSAEIGIAMGTRGTDVAREASDLVLMDDNFATIVSAVREGREIFHTLRKGVRYYLTVKMSLISIFVIPLILRIPFPFSPIQIIVIELFMDVAALGSFISEQGEKGIMKDPPWDMRGKFMDASMKASIILSTAFLVVGVTALYLYTYYRTGNAVEAQTAAFATWILSHVFLAQNLRSESEPILRKGFFRNRIVITWGFGVIIALVAITLIPQLQILLSTASLTAGDWILMFTAAIASTFWMEAVKIIRMWRRRGTSA